MSNYRDAGAAPRKSVCLFAGVGLLGMLAGTASAQYTFSTLESSPYLIIAMGPVNDSGGQPGVGQAFNMNNYELGANKAPVPSTSGFLDGGSSGGPGLYGNVPNIPLYAFPVGTGITNTGNVAITHREGVYNLQDVGVYANHGIRTAGSLPSSDAGTQNSFFNDPQHFPNTFTSTGYSQPGVNHNIGGFGDSVGPGQADQSTRMDSGNHAGVTAGFDFTALRAELADSRTAINNLAVTYTLDLSGNGGKISSDTTINLDPGLNVIDVNTGGNDFLLENSNLVFDGSADSKVIIRVPDSANFNIANSNILTGLGGIGLDSVLFFSDREDNAQHFNFSNTVLNGISFWTVANTGGEINIDNAQGSVQLIADKITLNDVRFDRCSFVVPAPGAATLFAMSAGLLGFRRRRA